MFKWFKRLWRDSGKMSKQEFGCKYFIPLVATFLTWGVVGHIYISTLSIEKLTPCKGEVTSIKTKLERGTNVQNIIHSKYHLKDFLKNFE